MTTRFLDEILQDVRLTSVLGDAAKGGWECQLETYQDTDAIVKHQAVALMFRHYAPDGYDEEERLAVSGHALPIGYDFDFVHSTARFNIATSHRFLETAGLQGIGFADQSVSGPGPWNDHQIANMRLGHIVEHVLEEHCNISSSTNPEGWVDTSDIDVTTSSRANRYNVHASNNMWATLQEVARNEFYYIYFDRANAVHYIPHPMFGTLPAPVMDFTSAFCAGRPVVRLNAQKKVSQVTLKATNEDGTVFTSKYPDSPADEGTPKELTHVRVGGAAPQARLDVLARRVYDWETRDYTVEWPAPGWSGFFFELLDRVQLSYVGTSANGVDIDWEGKYFWIHKTRMSPGPGLTGNTIFTLEEEPTITGPP